MSSLVRTFAAFALLCSIAIVLSPSRASALGNDALLFIGPSPLTVEYGDLEQQLRTAGASDVNVTASWPGGDLAATYRLVVVTPYGGTLDPQVGNDLAAFASVGGGIVIISEHDFGSDAGNAMATQLGITARFAEMETSGGCASTDVSATTNPLMNGVGTIDYAWSRNVTGGTLLAGTSTPILTTEGTIVLAGDSDIFSDPVAFGGCPHGTDNQRFFQNLFTALADPTHGMMTMDDGGAMADAGVPTELGRSCTGPSDCASGICLNDQGSVYCSMACTTACGGGYTCTDLGGGQQYCLATRPAAGGGCSASHARGSAIAWLALGLVLLAFRSRQPA